MTEHPIPISEQRYFVALPVPPDLKARYQTFQKEYSGGTLRWAHKDDLHITLRYIGFSAEDKAEEIAGKLAEIRFLKFHIAVDGFGFFENKKQTVLYAAVQSTRKLTALCTDVTDKLQQTGLTFTPRPYVPHITLARMNKNQTTNVRQTIERYKTDFRSTWEATSFCLMRSNTASNMGNKDTEPVRYDILQRYNLRDY